MNMIMNQQLIIKLCRNGTIIDNLFRKPVQYQNNAIGIGSCSTYDYKYIHVGTFVLNTLPRTLVKLLAQIELNDWGEDKA